MAQIIVDSDNFSVDARTFADWASALDAMWATALETGTLEADDVGYEGNLPSFFAAYQTVVDNLGDYLCGNGSDPGGSGALRCFSDTLTATIPIYDSAEEEAERIIEGIGI